MSFEQNKNTHLEHFPVVVKIEVREMRVRKGKKVLASWTPVSVDEGRKFKELSLCPGGSRGWCDANEVSGLEALQARLEGAVVEVKATTLASQNQKMFMVPEEIRELACVAVQCRDPVKRGLRGFRAMSRERCEL